MDAASCTTGSHLLSDRLTALRQGFHEWVSGLPPWPAKLRQGLEALVEEPPQADSTAVEPALRRLIALTEIWECSEGGLNENDSAEASFVAEALGRIAEGFAAGSEAEAVRWVSAESERRWGLYLHLLEPEAATLSAEGPEWPALPDDEPPAIATDQLLGLLLAGAAKDECSAPDLEAPQSGTPSSDEGLRALQAEQPLSRPAPSDLPDDLRDSFLAEAAEISDRLQNLLFQLPRGDLGELAREVGRSLHTLKGAAGCIGLAQLASAVHEFEERIAASVASGPGAVGTWLEAALKSLEQCVNELRGRPSAAPRAEKEQLETTAIEPAGAPRAPEASLESESTLRIPTERVDALSDFVQEIVSRGGFWNQQAQLLSRRITALQECRNGLAAGLARFQDAIRLNRRSREDRASLAAAVRRLEEQVTDLGLLAAEIRSSSLTQADEFEHARRTCEQLWAELQQIRVVPVRGLLQRLARSAGDAAQVEGRLIDVELVGEDHRLDRSIQERAFQPLLHLVRNAVGHGIEPADARAAAGKHRTGQVRIAAYPEGPQLVFQVEDDGRGLDDEAIEAKARRLGLIGPEDHPPPAQLHALVFRPGFSTREQANTIAGRGVGLDVVVNEVRRMRGSIELESRPGQGTRVAVHVPTRLALARMMIITLEGRLYGLPIDLIQAVAGRESGTLPSDTARLSRGKVCHVSLRAAFGLGPTASPACPILVIAHGLNESMALGADSVEGIQELVVKPLPALVRDHPALSGVCFTMQGDLVLVLNPEGVYRLASRTRPVAGQRSEGPPQGRTALMVDDSLSARIATARMLRELGFQVDEAADGDDALLRLRRQPYELLVTDLDMPRRDGFELLGELGREREHRPTNVLVISSRSDPETQARVLRLGADAFLAKPTEAERLARTVSALVSRESAPNARIAGQGRG